MNGIASGLRALALCGAVLASLRAATTTTWEMNSYQDFLKGRFTGISLDRDGRLHLAPKLETVFSSGQPAIWSMVQAPDGSIYAGTGHRGRVYRVDPKGANTLVWTADEPEVFAVAVDSSGVLYAASSPDGKVYRIENGKATEFFAPKTKYIWALAFASDGSLFVATGDPGNVYRVDKSGQVRTLLRKRSVARHRSGVRFEGQSAGRHRTERHPVPHQRQGQSVRSV